MAVSDTDQPQLDEHVFLIGRPPLEEYLGFLTIQAAEGQKADTRILADEWRAANNHISELEVREAGWADYPQIAPLPPALEPLRTQVLADQMFQRSFSLVPSNIGVVELDRLVVFQKSINLTHVHRIQETLSAPPSKEEIFRICLPFDHPQPAVRGARITNNSYVFVSPSNDLRFLETILLEPSQITNYSPQGPMAGAVGLIVGFGANYLQAIYAENRLILGNGSHRAYALRELGITHVPCVIQHVSRREELILTGAPDVQQNPNLYLRSPRPPLLKDYFNPKLRKLVAVPQRQRQVKITFGIEQVDIPAT